MHSLPILSELPPGYCVEESPRGILALAVDVAVPFHAAGFGPESDGPIEESDLQGREPLRQIVIGTERFVLRPFHHGGLLRWLTGRRYLDAERPFRELILSHAINRLGIRSPQVVAARARFAHGGGYHLDLVSRRIEDAVDLGRLLGAVQRGQEDRALLRRLLPALGRFLRSMHRQGLCHADMTPRNMLVRRETLQTEEPELWVLDLEGSTLDHLPESARRDNLRRLYRHVERMQEQGPVILRRTDLVRFLVAYDQGDGHWKDTWRAIVRARDRARSWHALGWWFDRRLGRTTTLPERDPLYDSGSSTGDSSGGGIATRG